MSARVRAASSLHGLGREFHPGLIGRDIVALTHVEAKPGHALLNAVYDDGFPAPLAYQIQMRPPRISTWATKAKT